MTDPAVIAEEAGVTSAAPPGADWWGGADWWSGSPSGHPSGGGVEGGGSAGDGLWGGSNCGHGASAGRPPQLRPVVDGPVIGVPVAGGSLEEALEWFRHNFFVATPTPSPLTTPRAASLPLGVAVISRSRNITPGAPGFAPPFQIPSVPGRPVLTPQAPSMGIVGARLPQLGRAPQAMLNNVSPKPKVQKELDINAKEKRIDDRLDERMDNNGQRSLRSGSRGRSSQAKKGKAKETRKMAYGAEAMSSDRSYGLPYSSNRPVASEHALGSPGGSTSRSSTLSSSTSRSASESAQTLVGFEVGTTFNV